MLLFRVRLLGTFEVERTDQSDKLIAVPAGRLRALFSALALRPGRPVSMTEIADRLWDGEPPPGARTTIRGYIKRLRRLLDVPAEPSVISSGQHGYRLEMEPDRIDLHRFRALLVRAAAATGTDDESPLLREALALWRGPAFCDVSSESLHREVVPALLEQYYEAVQRRIECDLAAGAPTGVIAELRYLVGENPLQEGFWAQLMRALHDAGRPAEALAAYERCRVVLAENLGADPGARLRELHRSILADGPGSAVPVAKPHQLPPEVPRFVGREQELLLLDGIRSAPMVISGPPGVGKTALAARWGRRHQDRFPDGELYVDLTGLSTLEALQILLAGAGGPDRLPPDVSARSGLFRSLVRGRRMLLVLDNALSAEQVRPLLPGGAPVVLITSVDALPGPAASTGAERLELAPLSENEASTLLRELLGPRRCAVEPKGLIELVEVCSGLPLTLRVAAEHANRNPRLSLADCAAVLRSG
ncbi:AfsR/SARP family transcriptional regulator [Amycolatopsis magusensis]|uniref:DNA-binding SARP family transcriptional activator n=1 Tax=Amycolatopsis magusensis TaxID=882444 RepID=A0ABS4PTM6_9PSEU|nr:BTAD domain-containing putative transcriptional regulator [Amycolatopsis magusensis]MBP2182775.1 DNA-binding SARP family transcriptional activator [Amycolatopsis magusensis]